MSSPFPPGPNGPQQPNQGWNQQPQGQPQQPQQPGWGQQPPPQGQQPGGYPPPGGGFPPPAGGGGFPPAGGQPGFYGGPPPPPPRSNKVKKIVLPIVGVVVLAGIGLGVKAFTSKDAVDKAKVGDCVTAGSDKKTGPKLTKCSDSDAAFKVVAKFTDSSDLEKCNTPDVIRKGSILGFYRTGSDKGLLCVTVTEHTTPASFKGISGASSFTPEMIAIYQKAVADGDVTEEELKKLAGE
ncbi:hypothetical protein [Streptomyces sp. SID3343]|uniref:LppU/SCO3897 family protein n=1 Tax=Streptomyces sp. SID3343 TaxID=2690260 RepID=UPI001369A8C9|nr:hypothetical protein [Streptomyces sp. SID3343]MYV98154.1 hypothetical protein [Streptomyces sp. SID3343]